MGGVCVMASRSGCCSPRVSEPLFGFAACGYWLITLVGQALEDSFSWLVRIPGHVAFWDPEGFPPKANPKLSGGTLGTWPPSQSVARWDAPPPPESIA